MQESFYNLADRILAETGAEETLLLNVQGEQSDFTRYNRSAVRQAGAVYQQYLSLELIVGQRHLAETISLTGTDEADLARAKQTLASLRADLPALPEDPYLLIATEPTNTEQIGQDRLPDSDAMTDAILAAGSGRDLVGLSARGAIWRGFANSLGQRNWFATHSFHAEWCFYAAGDKAIKTSYADFEWSDADFAARVDSAAEQLDILHRPARTIDPGEVRVYLAPAAMNELLGMVAMGGFSCKAHQTRTTSLLPMIEGGRTLDPRVTLSENTAEGLSPNFTPAGFIKPPRVELITDGKLASTLVSPRSGKEYDLPPNAGYEMPCSLEMAPGSLARQDILSELGEGIYAGQLWYLNYSDRPACRITGMTRFGTFWVEGGQIVAPLNVMRFDETTFRALGENLRAITAERDFLPDATTYGGRSTDSARLPGAIVDNVRFTL